MTFPRCPNNQEHRLYPFYYNSHISLKGYCYVCEELFDKVDGKWVPWMSEKGVKINW